jgi:hypothetical protein
MYLNTQTALVGKWNSAEFGLITLRYTPVSTSFRGTSPALYGNSQLRRCETTFVGRVGHGRSLLTGPFISHESHMKSSSDSRDSTSVSSRLGATWSIRQTFTQNMQYQNGKERRPLNLPHVGVQTLWARGNSRETSDSEVLSPVLSPDQTLADWRLLRSAYTPFPHVRTHSLPQCVHGRVDVSAQQCEL